MKIRFNMMEFAAMSYHRELSHWLCVAISNGDSKANTASHGIVSLKDAAALIEFYYIATAVWGRFASHVMTNRPLYP